MKEIERKLSIIVYLLRVICFFAAYQGLKLLIADVPEIISDLKTLFS